MQAVFVCGAQGTRLRPDHTGPKSLLPIGKSTLLAKLIPRIAPYHSSRNPPVVIVDQYDAETPRAVQHLLPSARIIRQPRPDGVANALLLAAPLLDDRVLVALGDIFVDGTFAAFDTDAGLTYWVGAPALETVKNFGIATRPDGIVSAVIEKPTDCTGLKCGMGVYKLTRPVIAAFAGAVVEPRSGERGMTDGIHAAILAGVTFTAIPFTGYYHNVNSGADVTAVDGYLAT